MPERIGEARIIAGQQRVDGENGHDRRRHGMGSSRRPGQPMDLDREDEQISPDQKTGIEPSRAKSLAA